MSARDDLVLLALGRLAPREREALTARLKQDPELAREAARIAAHLALYDRLPAPPEPAPVHRLSPRLGPQERRAFPWAWVLGGAAVVLVAASVLFPREIGDDRRGAPPWRAVVAQERSLADGRVRVVLDAGGELASFDGSRARLARGRAWFEVRPGAFRVETPHGDVLVEGTAFEVDVTSDLRVEVLEGRVRVGERVLEAGEGLLAAERYRLASPPARFARLADFGLSGAAVTPRGITLGVEFDNRAGFTRDVAGPEAAATGLLLAFEGPQGARHSQGVDVLAAAGGRLPPAGRLRLAPGERLEIPVQVPLPPGPAGSWRLTALYRPQGEAPLTSAPLSLEIPPR